ncbi:MAG: T9SS type A sorting domain-containing protein [Flavobacteriaceae bacterium]|nr:T9SS type A sorting domain-containing protein [Flavobacteriaceae bacterium]
MKKITFLMGIFICSIVSSQTIQDNLLLHYPFNGNTQDMSGNEYHAQEIGVTYVDDRHGNQESAIYFNGINNYINLPNVPELKPDLPVTFSFWVKYASMASSDRELFNTSFEEDKNTGIFFNSTEITAQYSISFGDGSANYTPATRRTYTSNSTIELNEWVNIIAVVQSSTNMQIYVNCEETGGNYSGTGGDLQYSILPGSIGRHDRIMGYPASYFKGSLDDFMYWDRVLNESEILKICDDRLAIEDNLLKPDDLWIYPNPSNGIIHIIMKGDVEFDFIQISDAMGKEVFNSNFEDIIDIGFLKSGIYIFKVYNSDITITKKIILE